MNDFKAISEGLQRIVAAQARKIEILEKYIKDLEEEIRDMSYSDLRE